MLTSINSINTVEEPFLASLLLRSTKYTQNIELRPHSSEDYLPNMTNDTSSSYSSSSLKRALTVAMEKKEIQKPSETRPGAFENCFATGLDLSEFSRTTAATTSSSTSNGTAAQTILSASSELLRIKTIEKNQRQEEEQQDQKLAQVIQQRNEVLQQRNTQKLNSTIMNASSTSPFLVADALVQMHGEDDTYKHTTSTKTNATKQNKLKRRKLGGAITVSRSTATNKQRAVTKKFQQSKYRR
jgi:hypothetical protein